MRFVVASVLVALSAQAFHASSAPVSPPVRAMLISSNHWHSACPVPIPGLRVLTLSYWGWDGKTHTGQLVTNENAVAPLTSVFRRLYAMHFEIQLTPAELRRGLAAPHGPAGEPDAAAEHVTCAGCDADAETAEFEAEFEDASAWEDAGGHSRWGLYDQLPLAWGQAEAGHD